MQRILALLLAGLPTILWAETAEVLTLCLDTELRPEDRVARLVAKGWTPDPEAALEALAMTLTIGRINAGDPTNWNADRDIASEVAGNTLASNDYLYLSGPDGQGVFIGRDLRGLQTCLYVGNTPDLGPLDMALDGSFVRHIDHVSRIRGDGVKSLIAAHAITDVGRNLFDPPLAFAMTFSVRLDRQP